MNEERFRSLMRSAIGDEALSPWLSQAVRSRIGQPYARPSRAPWFAAIAVCVALALLAVAVAPRLLHQASMVVPGGRTPAGVDPSNCTLPVIIQDEWIPPVVDGSITVQDAGPKPDRWGFLNTRTGKFTVDPSASPVTDMPVDPMYSSAATGSRVGHPAALAMSYSPATRRWLPVSAERVSPDGQSYAYLGDIYAKKLMRYDIASGQSVELWDAPQQIGILRWATNGILVTGGGPGLPPSSGWLVDPATGARTVVRLAPDSLPAPQPGGYALGVVLGTTATGDVIRQDTVLDEAKATVAVWAWIDTAAGKRTMIYQGTGPEGNLTDSEGVMFYKGSGFDAGGALADGSELWFSTFAPSLTLWHWDATRGLGKVDIDLPKLPLPKLLESTPAGPCVGTAAMPEPSPSPVAVNPFDCTLPAVQQLVTKDYLATLPAGFVNTRTGEFTIDASASPSVAGLPVDIVRSSGAPVPAQAQSYSAPARRWLPVSPDRVSPDGLSYAYLDFVHTTGTADLWRYDLTTKQSVRLWTITTSGLGQIKWTKAGILVPETGGTPPFWLVDPVTGTATTTSATSLFKPLPGDPAGTDGTSFHSIGYTADGHPIWWYFNLGRPGDVDWVFYETSPGKRIYVYRGIEGDSTHFNADQAFADSTGIWLSNYSPGGSMWHWDAGRGLQQIDVKSPSGSPFWAVPAGACF